MALWTDFYQALANAMSGLSGQELFARVLTLGQGNKALGYLHLEDTARWSLDQIDPFTVFGIFNRGQTDAHRAELGSELAACFGIEARPPTCFHGIPHLDPRKSIYDGPATMLKLFAAALHGPQHPDFAKAFDEALAVHGNGLGTLSIGLFWVRPYQFMALDKISIPWIKTHLQLDSPVEHCTGQEYAAYVQNLAMVAQKAGFDFPAITHAAFEARRPDKECAHTE